MSRRHAKRNPVQACVPKAGAISPFALGLDFGRSLLSEVIQQPCEQDGPILDLCTFKVSVEQIQCEVGVGRDEIEIPDDLWHDFPSGNGPRTLRLRLNASSY